ncbi:unnamed protein product [Linum tenue]|uniref:Fe2OG dioxygenase domain-containing protein n=1 Tax=Linum tenue TaxID=586396 RepID=A0AAV0PE94_9ROSI|nr:unnamed protein product [Linum tenue]
MASAAVPYDRIAELTAFDETKAGVKGLADAGITELPRIFHAPTHLLHDHPTAQPDDPNFLFPIIDLAGGEWAEDPDKRSKIVAEIRDASANWGFFQVVNHGFPASLVSEMIAGGHRAPDPPETEEMPACCRDVVTEYSKEILKFGELLFELLSEALGLRPNHLNEIGCAEGVNLLYNYYPACPQPEITLGTTQHADFGFISLLVQDRVGGLQVLHRDHWVDVVPDSEGIVVNIANLLQHRAVVKSVGPRVSATAFFGVGYTTNPRVYGPIEELLSKENPPKYKETTIQDFVTQSYKQGLNGVSFLDVLKLAND